MRLACLIVYGSIAAAIGCGSSPSSPPDAADTAMPDAAVPNDAPTDAPPDAPMAPALTAMSPAKGIVTTVVTLTGERFGSTQGASTVTVGGIAATVQSWSDTSITIAVPDVVPGDADVIVTTTSGATAPQPFRVILPPSIYLENDNAAAGTGFDTVTALAFDPSTGAVTQIGTELDLGVAASSYGGCSSSAFVHERTRRLFVTGSTAVAVFDIDPVTGGLAPVTGSPFALNMTRAYAVITNAAGTRLFVGGYESSQIAVLDIANDGSLTHVTGSPFSSPQGTDTIALSQNETYLYGNHYGGTFESFSVAATGAVTSLAMTQTGGTAIQRRPGADQLYVPASDGSLGVWTIETDGSLTALTGSPFALAPPAGVLDTPAFTADGARMYIGPDNSGYLLGYSLAADGTPTALAGSPWNVTASLTDISCIAVSADGTYLIAVGEEQQRVGVFALDAAGAPTEVANSPFSYAPATASSSGLAITF
jgi:6-phosphogluconolactonase (cycloisomerase 2 family)